MTSIAQELLVEPEAKSLGDYWAVLKRRRWHVIIPAIVVACGSVAAAVLLPPVYQSKAVILIEQPDVPPELVASTIVGYAAERVQVIKQRVLASTNLIGIIDKHNLYADKREREPISKIIEAMRKDISLDLISAEITDPRSGRPTAATIAFSVAFNYENAATAQRVANELVSLYLSENLKTRQQKAAETSGFLEGEVKRLERVISDVEKQLSELKRDNLGSLPEQIPYNLSLIARAESDLRALDQKAGALEERTIYLEAELGKMSPRAVTVVDGKLVPGPAEQLVALRTQLITLSARYGPQHPDVISVRRQVDALEREAGAGVDLPTLRRERDAVRTELTKASERYSPDHPDVMAMRRKLSQLDREIRDARSARGSTRDGEPADNPAYLQLQTQLEATRIEQASIEKERQAIRQSIADTQKKIEQTPLVERELARLTRQHETAQAQFLDVKRKETFAALGETLETERKAERFSLIEPPQLPDEPIKPNRIAILALGMVLSVGFGVGTAILAESLDTAVRGARGVAAITGTAPLVSVPFIRTRRDVRRAWRRRIIVAACAVAGLVAAAVLVDTQVMPLDILYAKIERRVEMIIH